MAKECMLTTIDNPFDPFEQFTSWLLFDKEKGYCTCEIIARIANISEDMTEKEVAEAEERAMDVIIKDCDVLNIYKKVFKESTNPQL